MWVGDRAGMGVGECGIERDKDGSTMVWHRFFLARGMTAVHPGVPVCAFGGILEPVVNTNSEKRITSTFEHTRRVACINSKHITLFSNNSSFRGFL